MQINLIQLEYFSASATDHGSVVQCLVAAADEEATHTGGRQANIYKCSRTWIKKDKIIIKQNCKNKTAVALFAIELYRAISRANRNRCEALQQIEYYPHCMRWKHNNPSL